MHHKLSRATLLKLYETSRENGSDTQFVQQAIHTNDHKAQTLPAPLLADYLALRRLFDTLIFHEVHTRTFSWITSDRQAFFFCPKIEEKECSEPRPRMSLVIRVAQQDGRLIKALVEEGADYSARDRRIRISLHTEAALLRCLRILKDCHHGYILPDAATWQAMQDPAWGTCSRICGRLHADLEALPQPDCWV